MMVVFIKNIDWTSFCVNQQRGIAHSEAAQAGEDMPP